LKSKNSVVTILIVFLTVAIANCGNSVLAQNNAQDLSISVTADKSEYVNGDHVFFSGYVYNTTTHQPVEATVQVEILKDNAIKFSVSEATFNGTFANGDFRVSDIGTFTISAKAITNGVSSTAFTTISVQTLPWYLNILGIAIPSIAAIFSVIYLLILLLPSSKYKPQGRGFVAAEFAFLTLFTFGVSLAFFFNSVPFGVNTPLGLVLNSSGNETQWAINIGGQTVGNTMQYAGGIQIPLYVIALAFLGAYAYFAVNVPVLLKNKDPESVECEGLGYLVRFFVAPLLAAVLYLILWQLDIKNAYILAATSFATGFVIEQVVNRITSFAKSNIAGGEEGEKRKPKPAQPAQATQTTAAITPAPATTAPEKASATAPEQAPAASSRGETSFQKLKAKLRGRKQKTKPQ
jgi:hypothetical protein